MAEQIPDRTGQIPESGIRCEPDPARLSKNTRLFHAKLLIFPHMGSISYAKISPKTANYWHVKGMLNMRAGTLTRRFLRTPRRFSRYGVAGFLFPARFALHNLYYRAFNYAGGQDGQSSI